MERALAPGRGYYARRGYPPRPVQLAAATFDDIGVDGWIAAIRQRCAPTTAAEAHA
jgi:hypothetical protein